MNAKFNFHKGASIAALASLSFGLMASCSDNSTAPAVPIAENGKTSTEANACIYEGYSAVPGTNGETICMDASGNISFWINADGSYGFPEALVNPEDPNSSGSQVLPTPISSSATITPDNPSAVSSSYAGISSATEIAISSESIIPISSSSYESVSNGNTPAIAYTASGASLTNDNGCVTINGGEVVISCAGDYDFSGSYKGNDAQIRVYSPKADSGVYLNLRGLTLENTADAPIYVQMASKTFVVAKSETINTLSDGSNRTKMYTYVNGSGVTKSDTTSAAIYAKDDLTIKGAGTLTVNGNYNNGIQSSNDLRFRGETIVKVNAKNNGIKGKGLVDIEKGNLTISATEGDGIKSDEATINGSDTTITEGKGIVSIKGGTITVTKAGDDGIQAFNYVMISDSVSIPTIKVNSTGKGIVSDNRVYINSGNVEVNSTDDGVHSNMNIYFNGGNTVISTDTKKGDGVHADSTLYINNGTIYVKQAYEGFEGWYIKASGGVTAVNVTDDGWNAAGGTDGSGNTNNPQPGGWGSFGGMGGMGGSSSGFMTITGGAHYVKTGSGDVDGMDSNGELTITGGVVVVECQISGGMGGSFDSDGTATITSKTLLGFSKSRSEAGNNYNLNFSTNSYYGNSNIAFKPTTSGSYVQGTSQVSTISSVSGYAKNITFPNGSIVYYND